MSASSLQRDGRDAYKRRDFKKALEYFNRAVGRGDPTPQLLDNLAATHDKLADHPAALAAAKKAIQAGRDDATGYLRAGIVLRKMDKPSVALEIYAYGLKSIKHVGQGYEQLKKVHDELQQELAPENSVDPLSMLPRELAVYILEYLSFRQRIAICRVSKGWMKFVRSEPNLWTHLDLSGARKKVKSSFVSVAINTARKKLTAATINQVYDFDKVLNALVRACPLESLTLGMTGLHGHNLVNVLRSATSLRHIKLLAGTEIGSDIFQQLIKACANTLVTVEYCATRNVDIGHHFDLPMPGLNTLNIVTESLMYGFLPALQALAKNAPPLKRIVFKGCATTRLLRGPIDLSSLTALEHLELDLYMNNFDDILLPRSLRTLNLKNNNGRPVGNRFFRNVDVVPLSHTLANLPYLRELELEINGLGWDEIDEQMSHRLPESSDNSADLSKLESLTLRRIWLHDSEIVFPQRLSELQCFGLQDCLDLEDSHVDSILKGLKNVSKLDLTGSAITGVAVRRIVKAGHVKELVVNECRNLGRDAIDWAREQGLRVQYRMTSAETSGRKLRML